MDTAAMLSNGLHEAQHNPNSINKKQAEGPQQRPLNMKSHQHPHTRTPLLRTQNRSPHCTNMAPVPALQSRAYSNLHAPSALTPTP